MNLDKRKTRTIILIMAELKEKGGYSYIKASDSQEALKIRDLCGACPIRKVGLCTEEINFASYSAFLKEGISEAEIKRVKDEAPCLSPSKPPEEIQPQR